MHGICRGSDEHSASQRYSRLMISSAIEVLWSLGHNAGSMERRQEYIVYGIQRLNQEGNSKGYKLMYEYGESVGPPRLALQMNGILSTWASRDTT